MQLPELVDEARLLKNAQRFVIGNPQEIHDAQNFVLPQRSVRHYANAKLARTAVTLEAVEQYDPFVHIHSLKRLLNASLCN